MKAKSLAAAVGIVVALGATALVIRAVKHRADGVAAAPAFEPAFAVEILEAREIQWQPRADLVGTVIALRSVVLSNEVEGVVTQVNFETGGIVEEGQTVLEMDASVERADLAAAEANVRVMESSLGVIRADIDLWESNVRRVETAVASKAVAVTELDNARAQLAGARARLEKAAAEVELARSQVRQVETQISKKTIKAPFKARVGIRSVHPGQFLALGTQIVGMQGVTDRIFLDFAIPQEYAQRVKAGDFVTATSIMLGDGPQRIEVDGVDAVVNTDTRNVRVRAIVPNPSDTLRPGMFVDISVPVSEPSTRVAIPSTAVRRAPFGDHVFMVVPGEGGAMRAKQTFIKLGPTVGTDVIVIEGLAAGDKIAAAGSFKLRDGASVQVGPPGGPGGGGGAGEGGGAVGK